MPELNARVFAPGLAPAGAAATLTFIGASLRIRLPDHLWSVPAEHLRLARGGFDGSQWTLAWDTEAGPASAHLPAAEAEAWLAQAAPAALQDALGAARQRGQIRRRRFAVALALVAGLAVLPMFLLGLFWLNADRVVGWVVDRVDVAQETRLGELAWAQMRPSQKVIDGGPALAMVERLGGRLTEGSAYRYRWFLVDDPEINAFALPGGVVVVHNGLIRAADTAEEVAGVLAHEVQHVELRHSLKNLLHGLGWRALLALALGDVSGGAWAGLAEHLGGLAYGRDLEREADLGGLAALRRAGIAPHGMVSFFAKLAAREGAVPEFLSSHPASAARMQALSAAVAAQAPYPARPLPYDLKALR
ncbi:MAG: M48 family metallopeptidase [Pseudomonadota bacterium]